MRVSVDRDDPGYANFRGYPTKVLLDGVEIDDCCTADEELGECLCLKKDAEGRAVVDGGNFATEIRRGLVKIIHPEPAA